jgi:hypothetical protein
VVALSEFDQVCYEDHNTNRLTESLTLFAEVANNKFMRNVPFVLFLNKRDLLDVKINQKKIQFGQWHPEFTEENTYENVVKWLKNKFTGLYENTENREFWVHVTCATDANNVKAVMTAVQKLVMNMSLKSSGLL